jgi:D-tyrosyl-tRNA(Tyr) deacylase
MKLLIQRAKQARVEVEGKVVGQIESGLVVFVGIAHEDTPEKAAWLANKLIHLRLFEDEEGKLNRSLLEQQGSALIISQFTLYADCSQGRRPSFIAAAPPPIAIPLYETFLEEVRKGGIPVQTGIFGANMQVFLINDGPVTLMLER